MSNQDASLDVRVEDGKLTISIGIDVLVWAFHHSDENNPFNDEKNDYEQAWVVTDAVEFAKDVRLAMLAEREDGSSLITDLFDKACQDAADDGSLALEEDTSGKSAFAKDYYDTKHRV